MIVGVGVDLVRTERVRQLRGAHGARFEELVFTPAERADCARSRDPSSGLAARFAAKEACLKALGTGWAQGLSLRQVEVTRGGRPELRLSGPAAERAHRLGVCRAHASLSHEPDIAGAVVILEA